MFGIGVPELIFIFLIILLVFGGKKIPEIAKGLGRGIREFKKAKDSFGDSLNDEVGDKPESTKSAPSDEDKKNYPNEKL